MSGIVTPPRPPLGFTIMVLLLGLAAVGLLFADEARAAVAVWIDSTAYGHCFFVIPIALFLAWERRRPAAATPVVPMPGVALLALPIGLLWLATERLGIMEGQQIMAMGFVYLLFLAVLGWRMCWVLAMPLLYLAFLVPFGAFLTPVLQDFTAYFIDIGLNVLGIAHYSDGMIIEIPEGRFFVAEACAGLRFLIASVAFGALYASMIYRSPGRRVAFIVASIIIPVVANGLRALGIVALGHQLGSAEAASVDHIMYGWIFFSMVIVLLILAGLPFREDGGPLAIPHYTIKPATPAASRLGLAAGCVLALAAIGPALATWFDRMAMTSPVMTAWPAPISGCVPEASTTSTPGQAALHFSCPFGTQPEDRLLLTITAFSTRADAGAMARLRRRETGELGAEDVSTRALDGGNEAAWRLVNTTEPDRITATAEWVDGRPARGGLSQRRLQAWNSIVGGLAAPVLVTITSPPDDGRMLPTTRKRIEIAIAALLAANPDFPAQVATAGRLP